MDSQHTSIAGLVLDSERGLSKQQVLQMREKFGRNELTPPEREPWWKLLLEKFDDPTIKILIAAAVISLLMTAAEKWLLKDPDASFIDSIGIFLAVLLATLVGYFSERKSAKEFELLNKVKDDIRVKVLREGQLEEISIGELVVGDLIRVDLGDKIPADGIVVDSLGLLVDQSLLTGESVPVEKKSLDLASVGKEDLREFEQRGMVDENSQLARGTMVCDGHGMFLVTDVGDRTKLGQIAAKLAEKSEAEAETPLVQKLTVLAKQISVVGVTASMSIFTIMALHAVFHSKLDDHWIENGTSLFYVSLVGAIVLSLLAYRFALEPFFSSMDMKPHKRWLKAVLHIPLLVGCWAILAGVLEIGFGGDPGLAIPMLNDLLLSFIVAVTIIVVAVPEGLPMMVTVSLALNMMKMAKENCLIRKLVASETIGSATIICTDKTGTLTQNKMRAIWFFAGMKEFDRDHVDDLVNSPEWNRFVDGIAINTEANLNIVEQSEVVGIGNPTECSLLMLLHENGVDYRDNRDKYPRIHELSHNSQRKMSMVMVKREKGKREEGEKGIYHQCFMKGAPERILENCSGVLVGGNVEPIEQYRDAIEAALVKASEQALRVIALSERVSEGVCDFEKEPERCIHCGTHVLVGLVGIADPIRPEVAAAVQTCFDAGIQVKMITGDALPTAVAIAKQAGILQEDRGQRVEDRKGITDYELGNREAVLTSEQFAKISDDDLPEVAENLRVLARSTPMDKLRLVKALHKRGEVVAMTGDGTNDAPALKHADVGLSMGIAGTEVAKEASDIVLMDDNFKSIVTGVWWGRTLYKNIQKFLQFQLSVNVVALLCALVGPMVGVPLPFTVTQLLWINIIMDTFAAIALSTDPPRSKTMRQKPISRTDHIITPAMGLTILLNSLYQVAILFAALWGGWFLTQPHDYAAFAEPKDPINLEAFTVFFTIFIMFLFWRIFTSRALDHDESAFSLLAKNRLFLLIAGLILVVQIIMVQASGTDRETQSLLGKVFRTEALTLLQWLKITALTATIIPVAWLSRQIAFRCGLEAEKR